MEKEPKEKNITKEEAKAIIGASMQKMAVRGANDRELSDSKKILENLEKNEITPQEAVDKVLEIEASKQDYR